MTAHHPGPPCLDDDEPEDTLLADLERSLRALGVDPDEDR